MELIAATTEYVIQKRVFAIATSRIRAINVTSVRMIISEASVTIAKCVRVPGVQKQKGVYASRAKEEGSVNFVIDVLHRALLVLETDFVKKEANVIVLLAGAEKSARYALKAVAEGVPLNVQKIVESMAFVWAEFVCVIKTGYMTQHLTIVKQLNVMDARKGLDILNVQNLIVEITDTSMSGRKGVYVGLGFQERFVKIAENVLFRTRDASFPKLWQRRAFGPNKNIK